MEFTHFDENGNALMVDVSGIFTWSINPAEKAVSLSTRESRDADEGQNGKRDRLHAVFHYRPV